MLLGRGSDGSSEVTCCGIVPSSVGSGICWPRSIISNPGCAEDAMSAALQPLLFFEASRLRLRAHSPTTVYIYICVRASLYTPWWLFDVVRGRDRNMYWLYHGAEMYYGWYYYSQRRGRIIHIYTKALGYNWYNYIYIYTPAELLNVLASE